MKILDLVPSWVYALVIGVLVALLGWSKIQTAVARQELATYKAEVAENTRKAEAEARAKEQRLQRENERIADEASKRERRLAANAATSQLAANSLRDEVSRLNARPMPTDPSAAAFAGEAAVAREQLGTCATEYRTVAEGSDSLRDQVIGLQDWVSRVCQGNLK
jgi:hypothetical protein